MRLDKNSASVGVEARKRAVQRSRQGAPTASSTNFWLWRTKRRARCARPKAAAVCCRTRCRAMRGREVLPFCQRYEDRPSRLAAAPLGRAPSVPHQSARGMSEKCQNSKSPLHSITSSAIASTPGGMLRPSALAVLRLMTNSNLVALMTGRSAGFSPLRTRPA